MLSDPPVRMIAPFLQKLFSQSPQMSTTTTNPTERVKEILTWFRGIEADEATYFQAADECQRQARDMLGSIARISAELRERPDPEKFRELARERSEHDYLHQLTTDSGGLFWQRRDIHQRRAAQHPDAANQIRALIQLAREIVKPKLERARRADEELTAKLDARDPVVSGATRKLEGILATADLAEQWLREDSDSGRFWQPVSGLVSSLEDITHE